VLIASDWLRLRYQPTTSLTSAQRRSRSCGIERDRPMFPDNVMSGIGSSRRGVTSKLKCSQSKQMFGLLTLARVILSPQQRQIENLIVHSHSLLTSARG